MRRLPPKFFISFVAFLMGLGSTLLFSQSRLAVAPTAKIPPTWSRINLDYLAFYGPADLKDQHSRGIDSAVWDFRNDRMTLAFDYGMYSNDLKDLVSEPQYRERWFMVDGRKAKVATFLLSEQSLADNSERGRPFIAAVYFPAVKRGGVKLSVWAYCIDNNTQEEAKKILFTIKFK